MGNIKWQYPVWAFDLLQSLTQTPPHLKCLDGGFPNGSPFFGFSTLTSEDFGQLYAAFYPQGKKTIPPDLVLTPRILATWLMDDGSRSRLQISFHTEGFTKDDSILLRDKFLALGFDARLIKARYRHCLRLSSLASCKLSATCAEYVLDVFGYKLVPPMDRFCIKTPLLMPEYLLMPPGWRQVACRHCGKIFTPKTNQILCGSRECKTAANTASMYRWKNRKKEDPEEAVCIVCQQPFLRPKLPPSLSRPITCGYHCRAKLIASHRDLSTWNQKQDPATGRFTAST